MNFTVSLIWLLKINLYIFLILTFEKSNKVNCYWPNVKTVRNLKTKRKVLKLAINAKVQLTLFSLSLCTFIPSWLNNIFSKKNASSRTCCTINYYNMIYHQLEYCKNRQMIICYVFAFIYVYTWLELNNVQKYFYHHTTSSRVV